MTVARTGAQLPARAPERPRRWSVVALATIVLLVVAAAEVGAEEAIGTGNVPAPLGSGDAAELLRATASSLDRPHVGRVSVVTFSAAGPRVADLDVRVDAMGMMELRRPTVWLVGGPAGAWLRSPHGALDVTPVATGTRLDVPAVLANWAASVGPPRSLDTGPATPVHLVRRSGAAVEEVVYVDHATSLPVRRETRAADGAVLRVVAYTSLSMVELGGPSAVAPSSVVPRDAVVDVEALAADGYDVPRRLDGGFELLGAEHADGMAVARYGDGLSALSVYQQHGRLDPSRLAGSTVRTLAGRHVWTWPGSEPLRLVWTGDDRTWTAVSDAPLEVVADAVASLPGEQVGHDVPSRIARGLSRAWDWLRGLRAPAVT